MNSLSELLTISRISLITAFALIFLMKMVLFFVYEKEWNSITFFHFSKIQLKMTVSKDLRKWRRRQNRLTTLIVVLLLLLGAASGLNLLIAD